MLDFHNFPPSGVGGFGLGFFVICLKNPHHAYGHIELAIRTACFSKFSGKNLGFLTGQKRLKRLPLRQTDLKTSIYIYIKTHC